MGTGFGCMHPLESRACDKGYTVAVATMTESVVRVAGELNSHVLRRITAAFPKSPVARLKPQLHAACFFKAARTSWYSGNLPVACLE